MKSLSSCFFMVALGTAAAVGVACDDAKVSASGGFERDVQASDAIVERQQLAASGKFLRPLTAAEDIGISATPTEAMAEAMAEALDIPAGMLVGQDLVVTDLSATDVLDQLGILTPRRGGNFAVMSTGVILGVPEPGSDLGGAGVAGDSVTLRVYLDVPAGINRLSFDYNFMSAEAPEFTGSLYNDTFVVRVTDALGTRQIMSTSVNDADFALAYDSVAKNTGYDINTDNPDGVDFEFNGDVPPEYPTSPDAGLTGFLSAHEDIAPGPVTLEFKIEDLGDGLLDSAVILDNLVLSAIEVIDPNNPEEVLINGFDGSLVTDVNELARGGTPVNGVAADGETQVVLRTEVSGPGQMIFSLIGGAGGQDARLGGVDSVDMADTVTVDVEKTVNGKYYAFARYTAPEDFNRGGDEGLARRPLRFSAQYIPSTGTGYTRELEIDLVRPPVVVLHALWSGCLDWKGTDIITDARFSVSCVDYDNAVDFATNAAQVFTNINKAIRSMRAQGIAVTQADVIGHGMGGLLARRDAMLGSYNRADNHYAGDINRLITMNTPHLGSRVADAVADIRALPRWPVYRNSFLKGGTSTEEGAVVDLETNSPAINAIPQTAIPSHAIYGMGGLEVPAGDGYDLIRVGANLADEAGPARSAQPMYAKMKLLHPDKGLLDPGQDFFFGPDSYMFCADDHDMFVSTHSQQGGIARTAATALHVLGPDDTVTTDDYGHWLTRRDSDYSVLIGDLLNRPTNGPDFAEFPSPQEQDRQICSGAAVASMGGVGAAEDDLPTQAEFDEDSFRIASPADGTLIEPGANISVSFETDDGFTPALILLYLDEGSIVIEDGPYVVDLKIPSTVFGAAELFAFAIDLDGNLLESQVVTLPVQTDAKLASLEILGGDLLFFGIDSSRQLTVLGEFDDGVTRELTRASLGTLYSTSDPEVAQVSVDGRVSPMGVGTAVIVARNQGVHTSIGVKVEPNDFCHGPLWDACTPECPCEHGQGDCDVDEDCGDGGWCLQDGGPFFGYEDPDLDVCVVGCPDVGNGAWNYCNHLCPCEHGEGDCDADCDCAPGLTCVQDAGGQFGLDPTLDMCMTVTP